jgi:hypothetical protein
MASVFDVEIFDEYMLKPPVEAPPFDFEPDTIDVAYSLDLVDELTPRMVTSILESIELRRSLFANLAFRYDYVRDHDLSSAFEFYDDKEVTAVISGLALSSFDIEIRFKLSRGSREKARSNPLRFIKAAILALTTVVDLWAGTITITSSDGRQNHVIETPAPSVLVQQAISLHDVPLGVTGARINMAFLDEGNTIGTLTLKKPQSTV